MKRSLLSALVLSAGLGLTSTAFGQIEGKITFDGQAPAPKPVPGIMQMPQCAAMHKTPVMDETVVVGEGGELANVVVYLKGDLKGEVPADEVVLDQQGCKYVPHVVSVTVGQPLMAMNSDPFLHNVHTLPEANPMKNFAQVTKGQKDPIPVKAAEKFKVKCDVHPWMSEWVAAFDHPFHGVTGDDGIYYIETAGLKDGEYEVALWHEKYKDCGGGKITIKDGKGTADFKVSPKAALAPVVAEKAVLVSTDAPADAAPANAASTEVKPACCSEDAKCAETTAVVATK